MIDGTGGPGYDADVAVHDGRIAAIEPRSSRPARRVVDARGQIKILSAFFQSATARTAGFNTLAIGALSQASLFTLVLLMFIGASPGSTGGGVKTTTFGILAVTTGPRSAAVPRSVCSAAAWRP